MLLNRVNNLQFEIRHILSKFSLKVAALDLSSISNLLQQKLQHL